MPLEQIGRLMSNAQRGEYAVGYFESWSLESVQGVIDAAEQTRSPIIIGFNGECLSQERVHRYRSSRSMRRWGSRLPRRRRCLCGFIFNECSDDTWVEQAITPGFNLVMPADPEASLENYTNRVARITTMAHARGVAVEADIEELPCAGIPGRVESGSGGELRASDRRGPARRQRRQRGDQAGRPRATGPGSACRPFNARWPFRWCCMAARASRTTRSKKPSTSASARSTTAPT